MASAKISCFVTASNNVMEDRNFMSSGDPRISSIDRSLARHDKAGAFDQARPEHVVSEIGDGFAARFDCEPLRHGAETEAGDLRKDEPHPMAPLTAPRQFLDHLRVDGGLRVDQGRCRARGDRIETSFSDASDTYL